MPIFKVTGDNLHVAASPSGAQSLQASRATASPAKSNPSLLGALGEQLARRSTSSTAGVVQGSNLKGADANERFYPALQRLREANSPAAVSSALLDHDASRQANAVTAPGDGVDRSEQTGNVSKSAPDAPNDHQARLLLDELTELESRCVELSKRLTEVVRELESGNTRGAGIAPELTALRTDFEAFQNRTVELARSLSVPADAPAGSSATLADLRTLLKLAADEQDQNAFRRLHAQATRELEDVLSLEYAGAGVNPLDECQSGARRLIVEIAAAQWPDSHPDCLPLVERRHTYSQLLDLVRQGDRLSDDEWENAEEAVARSFGRRLAVSAVRSRLRVKSGPAAPAQAARRCPACNTDLEPGARFCDECGVKLE